MARTNTRTKKRNWLRFDSPEAYADFIAHDVPRSTWNRQDNFCGERMDAALGYLRNGHTKYLDAAQRIMSQLGDAQVFTSSVPVLRADVAGIIPNVPGLLAGHPQGMFARHFEESPSLAAPMSLYVETTVSAAVSHDQLIKRGVAMMAFTLAMEAMRPVDLYTVSFCSHSSAPGEYGVVCKIASRPMDIGRAVYMLTDPSFNRRLAFTAWGHLSGTGDSHDSFPWITSGGPSDGDYVNKIREIIGLEPDDVFIKGGYITDKLMLSDPVQWVKNMIAQHGGAKDE